ncbi:CBS domain-containing protein [Pseudomonadota bacterium]
MKSKTVKDLMSTDLHTLGRNVNLSVAENLMKQEQIRHVAILDEDEQLCGLVTHRDLFRGALLKALGYGSFIEDKMMDKLLIKEVMTNDVLTTTPDTLASAAAQVMLEHKIGCLPVIENGSLVGMLTESDFVKSAN